MPCILTFVQIALVTSEVQSIFEILSTDEMLMMMMMTTLFKSQVFIAEQKCSTNWGD